MSPSIELTSDCVRHAGLTEDSSSAGAASTKDLTCSRNSREGLYSEINWQNRKGQSLLVLFHCTDMKTFGFGFARQKRKSVSCCPFKSVTFTDVSIKASKNNKRKLSDHEDAAPVAKKIKTSSIVPKRVPRYNTLVKGITSTAAQGRDILSYARHYLATSNASLYRNGPAPPIGTSFPAMATVVQAKAWLQSHFEADALLSVLFFVHGLDRSASQASVEFLLDHIPSRMVFAVMSEDARFVCLLSARMMITYTALKTLSFRHGPTSPSGCDRLSTCSLIVGRLMLSLLFVANLPANTSFRPFLYTIFGPCSSLPLVSVVIFQPTSTFIRNSVKSI